MISSSTVRVRAQRLLPSTTIITVLLESNSPKLAPIRFIAIIDGASSGAIGAE